MLQVCRPSPKPHDRATLADEPRGPQATASPPQPHRNRAALYPRYTHRRISGQFHDRPAITQQLRIYAGARPANQPGARPFPPTATRAVASLDEAERLDGVVLFLEGLDVVVDSGAGRVGNLEAVDDLPLATIGGDGEAEV